MKISFLGCLEEPSKVCTVGWVGAYPFSDQREIHIFSGPCLIVKITNKVKSKLLVLYVLILLESCKYQMEISFWQNVSSEKKFL